MTLTDRLNKYLGQSPVVGADAYVAPSAELIGAVTIGERASIWPKVVVRADINEVVLGAGSNLQDGVIVHLSDDFGVHIGENCTVGHGAILHACTIEDECLIGMRATVMDGATIGKRSIIGAHSLVTAKTVIPPGSLVMGAPAKVVRVLSEKEQANIIYWAKKYQGIAKHVLAKK